MPIIIGIMKQKPLSPLCPCCNLPMLTAAMSCPACQIKIEGHFRQTPFDRLCPEDLEFLEQYLLADFSIKTLEQNSSLGYAAIRSRLDKLIASYKELAKMDAQKKTILKKLSDNEITVSEAKEMLEKLAGD